MMRSMSSAVSGLKAQQTAMDVLGNNIANVNTQGFKSSSTQFEDLFYQNLSAATAETNPSQVGYGSQVAGVSKNMTSAGATQTDKITDLYVDGNGYFAVNTKSDGTGATYYTRVGNFHFDNNGYLTDSSGNYVMSNFSDTTAAKNPLPVKLQDMTAGTQAMNAAGSVAFVPTDGSTSTELNKGDGTASHPDTFSELSDISFGKDGSITASLNGVTGTIEEYSTAAPVGYAPIQVQINTFANEEGLSQVGNNDYTVTQSSGAANKTTAGANGTATVIRSSELEMSNVDVATEFTNMIVTQRGFQANSRVITTSDTMLEELVNLKRS